VAEVFPVPEVHPRLVLHLDGNAQRPERPVHPLLRPRLASGGEIARVEIEDVLVLDAVLGRAAGLQIP